ncbi:MAG: hypothetical protein LBH65_02465 [Desulfovibrio sp.]|nr:hypothetical protein [Desulfovibrio sp.]
MPMQLLSLHLLRAITATAIFCFVLSLTPNAAKANPLEALERAQRGIDECNSDIFNGAVDMPAVIDKASEALMAGLRKQADEGKLGDSNIAIALMLLGAVEDSSQTGLVKQLMLSEVKGFIATGINGGYFAGKPDPAIKPSRGSLASTLTKMPKGRREILPGEVLSHKDNVASVSGTFVDPKAGRFPLVLTVEKENGIWRIKEISNAQALVEEAVGRDR